MKLKQSLCGLAAHRYDPEELDLALVAAVTGTHPERWPECTRCSAPLPERAERVRRAKSDYRLYTAFTGWFAASALWAIPWEEPAWSIEWAVPILFVVLGAACWQITRLIGDSYDLTARAR